MQSGTTPQVADYFRDLETPDLQGLAPQLEQLVQQGVLTPEDAEAALAEQTAMNGISLDPRMKQAQMDALASLQDISSSGGMTDMDNANLQRIQSQEDAAARGKREAILQNASARGMGGSGMEIMAQLQNQQDSATRTSQRDLDVAGMAQQRALESLMQGGSMAGQMQAQDFNQQAQKAGAVDAISKFNAANQQQTNMVNTGSRNEAQARNMAAQQSISDSNVATRNTQQQQKLNLAQQAYQNQLNKRQGQAGLGQTNAQIQGQNSQNQANANNQTMGTMFSAAGAFAGKKDGGLVMGEPSDQDTMPHMLQPGEMVVRKDDVPEMMKKKHTDENGDFDVSGFLDEITGYKYGYSKGKK